MRKLDKQRVPNMAFGNLNGSKFRQLDRGGRREVIAQMLFVPISKVKEQLLKTVLKIATFAAYMAIKTASESHLYMYECTFSRTKGIKSPAVFP
jgi:hypothetical protein